MDLLDTLLSVILRERSGHGFGVNPEVNASNPGNGVDHLTFGDFKQSFSMRRWVKTPEFV